MSVSREDLIGRLGQNPDDHEAFVALRRYYHERADWPSLANLVEAWAARSKEPSAAAAAFFEAGELSNSYLRDQNRAVSLFERALRRDPLHLDSSSRLQEIFDARGEHRRLLELLDSRANSLTEAGADPRHIGAAHQLLGEVWERRLGRVDRAITHYRKAFEADPSLVPAIYAAREIYRAAGNLKAAASLYELEANAEVDRERKIALLRELALLRSGQLGDEEGAIATLRKTRSLAPGELAVMHDLATMLLRRADRQVQADQSLKDRVEAADLLFNMSQAVPPEHGLSYAQSALDAHSSHAGALDALSQLCHRLGRQELLPPRWVEFLKADPNGSNSTEVRRRLGEAYLSAGQEDDALVCLEVLLERRDEQAAAVLVDIYRRRNDTEKFARALSIASASLPTDERRKRLLEVLALLRSENKPVEAAHHAREILDISPADPEALSFLDGFLTERDDYQELSMRLQKAARAVESTPESRKDRLARVALLSEERLNDPDGAISAYRAIVSLDPTDKSAPASLRRLLEAHSRWDELCQLLEGQTLTVTDPDEKVATYLQLATIHHSHRGDARAALSSLRAAQQIAPENTEISKLLSDLLVEVGQGASALPLLEDRVARSEEPAERLRLLHLISRVQEEQMRDPDAAFLAATRALDIAPGDPEALDRMVRIDEQAESWDRLLSTFAYRAELSDGDAQVDLLLKMGRLAEDKLDDRNRAAEYYARASEIRPDPQTLDRVCEIYEKEDRFRDLVIMLRQRAEETEDRNQKQQLYLRIARVLALRIRNEVAAEEAYRLALEAEETEPGRNEEALRYLLHCAVRTDNPEAEAELTERLASVVPSIEEQRDLLLRRSEVLLERLKRTDDAIACLEGLLMGPHRDHIPGLSLLERAFEEGNQTRKRADVLERMVSAADDDELRLPIARSLADLYELELEDKERARGALERWSGLDPLDEAPIARLADILEASGPADRAVAALDSLAGVQQEGTARLATNLRAARIAFESQGDFETAYSRLVPWVKSGNRAAEERLLEYGRQAGQHVRLGRLLVDVAQSQSDAQESKRSWLIAGGLFQAGASDSPEALEAYVRALAIDMADEDTLLLVEAAASETLGWDRLGQVYDGIVRATKDNEAKAMTLARASGVFQAAGDANEALDRILRACALSPDDEVLIQRAEEVAILASRSEELLVIYDRSRSRAEDDFGRVGALLSSARVADQLMADRERALGHVAQAVAVAIRSPEAFELVEEGTRALDDAAPASRAPIRATLVDLYRRLAEQAAFESPARAAFVLGRASSLAESELSDPDIALACLESAVGFDASRELVERYVALGKETGKLEQVERRLAKLVEQALDPQTASALLRARGDILAEELGRHAEAADVYQRLSRLSPEDTNLHGKLAQALTKAGRPQDILISLERNLRRAKTNEEKLALRKQIAETWENDLSNKWEAIDAWKAVLRTDARDTDAMAALARLKEGSAPPRKVLAELDEDETVDMPDAVAVLMRAAAREKSDMRAREEAGENAEPTPEPASAASDASPVDSVPSGIGLADSAGPDAPMSSSPPAEARSANSAPADSALANSAPADSALANSAPADSALANSAPADWGRSDSVAGLSDPGLVTSPAGRQPFGEAFGPDPTGSITDIESIVDDGSLDEPASAEHELPRGPTVILPGDEDSVVQFSESDHGGYEGERTNPAGEPASLSEFDPRLVPGPPEDLFPRDEYTDLEEFDDDHPSSAERIASVSAGLGMATGVPFADRDSPFDEDVFEVATGELETGEMDIQELGSHDVEIVEIEQAARTSAPPPPPGQSDPADGEWIEDSAEFEVVDE